MLVTTKSGSNDFHGSLFEFLRNTSLDAKSFFATTPEKFNLNQFGGSIGGPIRKNKTFFFLDGEQKDQLHGITFTGLVPSAAMHTSAAQPYADFSDDPFGNPVTPSRPFRGTRSSTCNHQPLYAGTRYPAVPNNSISSARSASGPPTAVNPNGSQVPGVACAKIPAALVNPLGAALVNLYPVPNANNAAQGFNFVSEPVRSLYETKFDIRVDHTFPPTTLFSPVLATTTPSPTFLAALLAVLPRQAPSAAIRASSITPATWPLAKPTSFHLRR